MVAHKPKPVVHVSVRQVLSRILEGFSLSIVSYMELVQGLRNKHEQQQLRQALRYWQAEMAWRSRSFVRSDPACAGGASAR
ncbi:hypothetical protein CKO33_00980 [Ectothiorhodospira mobilis]|nr:hypothetical protein [Ectothiorhodospira mobilis]